MLSLKSLTLQLSPLVSPRPTYNRHLTTTVTCCSAPASSPPVVKKRKRFRKPYPGEVIGITEELRFVAMRLRNIKGKYTHENPDADEETPPPENNEVNQDDSQEEDEAELWVPTLGGFLQYLVDSKLVFETVERIVDQSDDVSYAYFRKTGLERSEVLERDLEWLRSQGREIPEPREPGISYSKYLEELASKSAPLFLSHYYNIYLSHVSAGQVIARQVSEKVLEGRELEFCQWDGDVEELLKSVRENLNMLSKHWMRDEKNKCLKEATKCFNYLGQIVRLVAL